MSSRRGARSVDQTVGWTGPACHNRSGTAGQLPGEKLQKVFGRKRRKHERRLVSSGIEQWRCSEPNTHWNRSRAKDAAGRLDEPRERGCLGVFASGQMAETRRLLRRKGWLGSRWEMLAGDGPSPLGDRIGRHAWERLEIASCKCNPAFGNRLSLKIPVDGGEGKGSASPFSPPE